MDENIREEILQENKMGTMPVGRLLFSMAVPMMVSMLFQALYNVVDSIFVAKLSQDAMNAVSLAFPLQTLCIAFSGGTGVGMNALLSRSLGEKNQAGADRAANVGLFLTLCNFALFALIGWTLAGPFFRFQTDNPQIITYGRDYVTVCIGCSIGLFFQMYNERLLQSTGRTNLSMITQIAGAATNIVLDPILIFGLLGFPALGLRGAAIANMTDALRAEKMQAFAARFCRRFPKDSTPFELLWPRYARTADGEVELDVFDPVERYTVADSFGEGFLLTEALAQQARAEGISFVVSPDALNARKIRSLYFPATGTFVAVGEGEAESKRINMKRFIDPEKEKETRRLNRLFRKGCRLLLDDATEAFASARTLHFELEDIYVAAMDFRKADRLRDMLINEIF